MNYEKFLDAKTSIGGNHGFTPTFMPSMAFDFQKSLIEWATLKGRAAVFADCGMGKSLIQLAWSENVVRHTAKPVLILTPLAVGAQTVKEAEKFGIEAVRSLDGKFPAGARVVIANYERLHLFDPTDFAGTVCDESSILKNFDGVTKDRVTAFMRKQKFRLLCTATAAPNDFIELGTSSEALGYLGYMDMLGKFFKKTGTTMSRKDENRFGVWRFRGHAERDFWRWVVSWARAIRRPSDLGFDDGKLILPPLTVNEHIVAPDSPSDGMLFNLPAVGLQEQRSERSRTTDLRCEKAAALVANTNQPAVMWCYLNSESTMLRKMVSGSVEVCGADSDEEKEEKFEAFASGEIRVLVTKPTIAGFGLNWQHCNHQTFFPSHSFEQFYQSVRRSWRFGQTRPVTVDLIASDGESGVVKNLQRKADAADKMFANLVSLMGNELHVARKEREAVKISLPSFI